MTFRLSNDVGEPCSVRLLPSVAGQKRLLIRIEPELKVTVLRSSFDYLVGLGQQARRDLQSQRLRGLQVSAQARNASAVPPGSRRATPPSGSCLPDTPLAGIRRAVARHTRSAHRPRRTRESRYIAGSLCANANCANRPRWKLAKLLARISCVTVLLGHLLECRLEIIRRSHRKAHDLQGKLAAYGGRSCWRPSRVAMRPWT